MKILVATLFLSFVVFSSAIVPFSDMGSCQQSLEKGAKIVTRMLHETDNKIKLALDLALLNNLYKNKIQPECNINQDINLQAGGTCMEAAYKLSLTVQNLTQALGKGNLTAGLNYLQQFLDDLPDTLDACGQSQWAAKIRKDFPAACLKSIDDLGDQLIVFQHHFDHLEWIVSHWKDLSKVLGEVKKTCPVFA